MKEGISNAAKKPAAGRLTTPDQRGGFSDLRSENNQYKKAVVIKPAASHLLRQWAGKAAAAEKYSSSAKPIRFG